MVNGNKIGLPEFRESPNIIDLNGKQRKLLSSKISELSLTIKGTCLEEFLNRLYRELEEAGIRFKPKAYLTDEWGCPNKVPVIGIPFYLANPQLSSLIKHLTGISTQNDEVMMLLRHEAGHTFNYAYHLYRKKEWRRLFGRFSKPYKSYYIPVPFSAEFVQHLSGWYAQRHPDDDFAETFAIWLTPNLEWREQYLNTSALAKLLYVDEMVRMYGQQPPDIIDGKLDMPVKELEITLYNWIRKRKLGKYFAYKSKIKTLKNNSTF